jgi:dipeptidyl aminopeptidase/acylaminoacyl peptidase
VVSRLGRIAGDTPVEGPQRALPSGRRWRPDRTAQHSSGGDTAGVADPARLVLSGGSWGGYLTLLGLGRQNHAWTLGIAAVPIADLAAHYEQQSTPLQAYWRSLFGGTPDEISDTLPEISPIEFADQVNAPVLMLIGDNDPRCPLGQAMNYVERLRRLGKPIELYRYDAGHESMVVDEQYNR